LGNSFVEVRENESRARSQKSKDDKREIESEEERTTGVI
jgi:hypothetical protein